MAPIAPEISRRAALCGAALLIAPAARAADGAIAELERKTGSRIGLAALDTGSGKTLFHREAERFVMCSTFKLSLAAAILSRAGKGAEKLDRLVMYDKPVLGVSPATARNWPNGMTVAALCEAAIIYSDNTAANVLLQALGGPGQVTASGAAWEIAFRGWTTSSPSSMFPMAHATPRRRLPCWAT